MNIGIMGGTFNPVHLGHLILAEQLSQFVKADKVLFIPCAIPPHKTEKELASCSDRLAMLTLALEEYTTFELCDIEIKEQKRSYSLDTLLKLKERYPQDKLFFYIGEDSLVELDSWKGAAQLVRLCTFVTAKRFFDNEKIDAFIKRNTVFSKKTVEILLQNIVETKVIDISSSGIRTKIREDQSIRDLVPKKVEAYIKNNQLYRKK